MKPLELEEGIKFNGTFDSMKRKVQRVTIYRAMVTPEECHQRMLLELQRDKILTNKLFVVVQGEQDFEMKELNITVKQATHLLMSCNHDFGVFVQKLLCVKHGQLALRNLTHKVFDPTKSLAIKAMGSTVTDEKERAPARNTN